MATCEPCSHACARGPKSPTRTPRPDPALHAALTEPASLLAFYLGAYDRDFAENDHPDTIPEQFLVCGDHDRAYLSSIAWQDEPPEDTRAYRRLSAQVWTEDREDPLRYGYDSRGALVVHHPGDRKDPWSEWYITLRPPADGIPAGAAIVADAGRGDRPAYIQGPGERITPLPRVPSKVQSQWSFGYSGGGPGALAAAIASAFVRADNLDPRPPRAWTEWIDNQVCFGLDERPSRHREMTELRLPVDTIRERYARA
ncbi:hypothetical protein [Amycolatopsis rubida]|uniref:Uncharacterized protein n=1 Tax=Amycolatopsis rubida TaxID=112413 RepID=A0A1I5X6N9_9PSEU|nr:hypothetical protein [Amycolatopsis rubida]SFQ27551.1 hypothetical protein SAMN05421854_11059 [Amycolatopsis rubida]